MLLFRNVWAGIQFHHLPTWHILLSFRFCIIDFIKHIARSSPAIDTCQAKCLASASRRRASGILEINRCNIKCISHGCIKHLLLFYRAGNISRSGAVLAASCISFCLEGLLRAMVFGIERLRGVGINVRSPLR